MISFLKYSLWIALGGAVGAMARFWCTEFVHRFFERGFPVGTLCVNVIGSFLIGYLSLFLLSKLTFTDVLRSFVLIGILGAFTTFSTFSLDTVNLFLSGKFTYAVFYVLLSILLCVIAAGLGVWLAV